MHLKLWNPSEGVFKKEFRKQWVATFTVTIISFCHGIILGWLSPMLTKLQSPTNTPLSFTVNVEESSWIGSFITIGGISGNIVFGLLLDRISRKKSIYCLAFPHVVSWILLYYATSIEYLYAARICGGFSGGGIFVVLPIYIGEIADSSIRGRLSSMFSLTMNSGILCGFILASHLPYHLIPCIVVALPLFYLLFASYLPETPQYLLRCGYEEQAEQSLKYYRNYNATTKLEIQEFDRCFAEMRLAVTQQKSQNYDTGLRDFLNKSSLKAVGTCVILMAISAYTGQFALMNYMSSIFAAMKTDLDPDTNTIIIGVVQIVGIYVSILLVDQYGRKILMIVSTAGMGIGLAALGMYAFFAEETDMDLSQYSSWLPLLLMAFAIFMANVGIISVTFVLLVEILPMKIRSLASSFCLTILGAFGFSLLKGFPVFMDAFGLSSTMWFCASVCAFALFYISVFLKETKGKSIDGD